MSGECDICGEHTLECTCETSVIEERFRLQGYVLDKESHKYILFHEDFETLGEACLYWKEGFPLCDMRIFDKKLNCEVNDKDLIQYGI